MGAVGAGASDLVSLCAACACNDGLASCRLLDRRGSCLIAFHAASEIYKVSKKENA